MSNSTKRKLSSVVGGLLEVCVSFGICLALISPVVAAETSERQSEVEGRIVKVVPSKREIYVQDSERKHEYYFNEQTKVVSSGGEKSFSDLQEGQKVKVTARKIGKRLDPLEVQMLD